MNFAEMKNKYPKCFDAFYKYNWGSKQSEMSKKGILNFEYVLIESRSYSIQTVSLMDMISGRRWYDFFDLKLVFVSVMNYINNPVNWGFYIQAKAVFNESSKIHGDNFESTVHYKQRSEAEKDAFEKACEILESRLK